MTVEKLFWELARELAAEDTRVVEGTIMNGRCTGAETVDSLSGASAR